ncbi:tyrosine-type recombinase/integrase [Sulfitobacter sp. SBS6]|uniref:tyrosine-type recombinase/integrase n=1 Tax=Sulfitobacter sp. SBS6 TaxID=3401755 RepID=UPI003AAC69B8
MVKLTAQYVRDLSLTDQGQRLVVDSAQPGFGVRVGKTSKAYIAESRVRGKTCRVTIGRTDKLTLPEARKLAVKALAEMADGRDRNAEKRQERAKLMTLGQAVEGWLNERDHRVGTANQYRDTMDREFSDWQNMQLRQITPKVFQTRFHEMMERTQTGAALAVRTFKSCWNWARAEVTDAEGRALLPECPAEIVRAKKLMPKAKRKQTYVSNWCAFFDALEVLETNSNRHQGADENFRLFIELLARTGLRRNEAANLRWSDVNMEARTLTITADRAKNGEALTLPMSNQTVELFERVRDRTEGQTYLWGADPYGDPRRTLMAFRELLGWNLNFHDLRRSFATIATELDIQQSKIMRLLNHATGASVTLGYQVSKNPETLRSSVQEISDFIDDCRRMKVVNNAA